MVTTTYRDENWRVKGRSKGMFYSIVRKTYDETGKLVLREEYFDGQDRPTRINGGVYYGKAYEYDDLGRLVTASFVFDLPPFPFKMDTPTLQLSGGV